MDVAAGLRATRDALVDAGPSPGRAWCRAWSAEVDGSLRQLAGEAAPTRGRFAVVALGGYGRSELAPASDVDVLLLTDGVPHDEAARLARAITHPLWDAGLTVGHALRTPAEAVAAALLDTTIATATLDGRPVAGVADLVRQVRHDLVVALQRRADRFLAALADADGQRRARYGEAAEVLEPNLKHGAGGLRDVQSLRWAAAAVAGEVGLDPLVTRHELSAADRTRVARAYELLLAARVALHLEAGRVAEQLTFDRQDPVAARLGRRDGAQLLHELFLAARAVERAHRAAWALLTGDVGRGPRWRLRRPVTRRLPGGFTIADDVLRLDGADLAAADLPVRLLEALTTSGAVLDRADADRLTRAAGRVAWGWDDASRQRFVSTLWHGRAADALATLDDVGAFEVLVPEWAPVRARPQRNPIHRWSLDRHAFETVDRLAAIVTTEPWAAERLAEVTDREGLVLGALLHDVGKAYGEPHSETGVDVARSVVARMGAPPATVDLVGRLVRHHLLLPEVATRRDLADPALVASVAATVGDRPTLACLHLLAAADGQATGPTAWTSWKATLVATLAEEVAAVLDDARTDAADATAAEAGRIAPDLGVDPAVVRRHLELLPARYAASVTARAAVRHAGVAEAPLDPTEVRTRVVAADGEVAEALDVLDVVARDRPGLFSKVAGVIALHGGSIRSAHAFTRRDGVAVDSFTVERPADERPGMWWAAVEGDLVDAVAGRLALRARLTRQAARRRPPRRTGPPVETRVEVSRDASDRASIVEVRTEDAVGVLYRIAAALAELELDIVAARVDTVGHEVVDVFYVRDPSGRPLDDDHTAEVVLAVTAALT